MVKKVVVTGLGAITPIGNDVPTFWSNLIAGKNGIDKITYFDTSDFKASLAAEVKDFDVSNYFEPNEARKTDPFVQFAVASAKEALEQSGIIGAVEPERLGVYFGSGIGGFQTISTEIQKLLEKGPKRISPHFIPAMIGNIAASTIAIHNNAKGPILPIVTACATSSHTIGEAYRAILSGYADAIICGGSEAAITPVGVAGFTNCMALSTTDDVNAASIPFDARRNGFVMAEGAATIILEESEHAKARGAKILAEVVGYGNTSDAYHLTSPDPTAAGPSRAIIQAIEGHPDAGNAIEASSVYVNAHGTSTALNDSMETKAFKLAFGEEEAHHLQISSTKSMTGHMLGAAGAVEAIACIKALQDEVLPPTLNYKEADPECDLDYIPNVARQAQVKFAISTSFGFGGHNAALTFKKWEQ